MNILVTGQTTMQIGRMENGNIGNYYVLEPFFREIHRVFPDSTVQTTLQLTDRFCRDESVVCLPIELYYNFNGGSLEQALCEVDIAEDYLRSGKLKAHTPFIDAVLKADVVLDLSGDIWGSNADLLAADRFEVGLYKNKVSQMLGKHTALISSSPGPFAAEHLDLAKEVFSGFDVVANREPVSSRKLRSIGFDLSNVIESACPAFIFDQRGRENNEQLEAYRKSTSSRSSVIGLIVCGFNFKEGPHTKWPRSDDEYSNFVATARYVIEELGADVCLMSHSNGFTLPPEEYRDIHGSDYKHAQRLYKLLCEFGYRDHIFLLEDIYSPWTTKSIIAEFDMLVSGRIHAAVAGFSQAVPTVVLDYGHAPKAHKLEGFTELVDAGRYLCDPTDVDDMTTKIANCWNARGRETERLKSAMARVETQVHSTFDQIAAMIR
jgi:colanic acid/amylovoran biosynthesis protein